MWNADINLANKLIDEFPCRPHWTKNTRNIFERSVKNLDTEVLSYHKLDHLKNSLTSNLIVPFSVQSHQGPVRP